MDTSQLHSPTTLIIAQWTHEQNDHGGREGGYAWAQQGQCDSSQCWVPDLPAAETNTELPYGTIPQVIGWLRGGKFIIFDTPSTMEGAVFCPYWNRHIFCT